MVANNIHFYAVKVTIAKFLREHGDIFLEDEAVSLGAHNPISLSRAPENSAIDSALINKATELVLVDKSRSHVKRNYVSIWASFVYDGNPVDVGYIFNQSEFLWQRDVVYSATQKDARVFINSLNGTLVSKKWQEALKSTHRKHLCYRVQASGEWRCTCKGFMSALICSHIYAALAIMGTISLASRRQLIPRARVPGRPANDIPAGFSAHRENQSVYQDSNPVHVFDPSKFIALDVATRFGHDSEDARIYIGKITGTSLRSVLLGFDIF